MCFSPMASFVASFFLGGVYLAAYRKVLNQNKYLPAILGIVLIPFFFAIQQFSEGFVWLSLLYNFNDIIKNMAINMFMFFAFIFWPAYTPISMYRLEQNNSCKKILKILILVGFMTAIFLLERLCYFGVNAQLANCHIMYNSNLSQFSTNVMYLTMAAYLLATCGSLLVSTFPRVREMGILISLAYIATYLFYVNFLISVWCFFAAIISLLVYWVVARKS